MDSINPPLDMLENTAHDEIKLDDAVALSRIVRPESIPQWAAAETISPRMSSSLNAAALCRMLASGGTKQSWSAALQRLDRPISRGIARTQSKASEVSCRADIIVMPGPESGKMTAKQPEYLAGGVLTGVVMDACVPIVLTHRAVRAKPVPRPALSSSVS
ncbi:MAG: bifunctional enoyl-CoA hydratase/phosphate acetyltransferase [Proteobacteria bacterium]|nr:bifunctional enoyl-CoA hydratase/phosphate acetyltransferase [Pseudomonadota bacterium]